MQQQKIKTIVVGVDFSEYSKIVVKQANLLSKLWKTNLVLVHAVQDPVQYAPAIYVPFPNLLPLESYESEIMKFYKITSKAVKLVAVRGVPSDCLIQIAKKQDQPMIMVGYKGNRPIAEFFFGSTAQSLVFKAKMPVWIQRGRKVMIPKKVLVPHDLSLEANESIDMVKEISEASPLKYEVFFVQERPYPVMNYTAFTLAEMHNLNVSVAKIRRLKRNYPNLSVKAEKGNLTTKVQKQAKNFDLLVMSHHNPKRFFGGSETVNLLQHVNKPALIV